MGLPNWLQQMLIRSSASEALWSMGLWQKAVGWHSCLLHRAKCCLLLLPWPTHPISFCSALLGWTRRLPPAPRRHLQGQEGSPETAELLCKVQLSCAQIILRFWRRPGMYKSCHSMGSARCCTWKGGSRLWQPGGKGTTALKDWCLLFQIETILERHILHRNLLMFSLDLSEVLLRKWKVKHLYLVVCHFLSDSWLHFRNVFSFSELNQFGIL